MIIVSGITGQTGAATARHLIAKGERVTGLSRNPSAALEGGEVANVDLADTAALTVVLRGASAFYVLLPPQWGVPDVFRALEPIIDSVVSAIEAADVPRVVVLSSIAAHVPDGTGPIRSVRPLEARLAGRDGVTFLRPAYFLENLAGMLDAIRAGQLPTFWDPAQVVSVVGTDDIGATAAELLLSSDAPKVVQLAGPEDVSFDQVAAAFGRAIGTPVLTIALPPAAIEPQLTEMGAGHLANLYAEMNQGVADGRVAFDPAVPVRRSQTSLDVSIGRLLG